MNAELVLLRVALVLGLWAIPLAVGLIAHLGGWRRPAMAWAEIRLASEPAPRGAERPQTSTRRRASGGAGGGPMPR